MNEDLFLLGVILGPFGIKGAVKIKSFTDDPADIVAFSPLQNDKGDRQFKLKLISVKDDVVTVKIAGVDDRNVSETLNGTQLYCPRERLPKLKEKEFYIKDLIGLKVFNAAGDEVGHVTHVDNYGAGDLVDIFLTEKKRILVIPFKDEFIPTIDIAGGVMTISDDAMMFL